jgi:hypothetical protein
MIRKIIILLVLSIFSSSIAYAAHMHAIDDTAIECHSLHKDNLENEHPSCIKVRSYQLVDTDAVLYHSTDIHLAPARNQHNKSPPLFS